MQTVFEDRHEAGRALAKHLSSYSRSSALVLAIPRGGVPVAAAVAQRLRIEWNFLLTRKMPIPWNPEAGFGAIAADGSRVLNSAMVDGLQLGEEQIEQVADGVREELERRSALYCSARPASAIADRRVILVDDGLASGYTMLAAVRSARAQAASRVTVAAPVASRSAVALLEQEADESVFAVVSPSVPFAVADFYLKWRDLSDDDVMALLRPPKLQPDARA